MRGTRGRIGSQEARRLFSQAVRQSEHPRRADDEDGDRSYNFRMVIQVSNDPSLQPVPVLNTYLRGKFDNENIRVVTRPKKTDSLEAYIGEEFLGVLFVETEKGRKSYIFELPILDVDLDGGPTEVE
jgi:hypothetical protein